MNYNENRESKDFSHHLQREVKKLPKESKCEENTIVSENSRKIGIVGDQSKENNLNRESVNSNKESNDWQTLFNPLEKNHVLYGNCSKSRVFIISGNCQQDQEYVKALELESNIQWKVSNFVIQEYSGLLDYSIKKSTEDLINEIKSYCPTNVILNKITQNDKNELIEKMCNQNICKSVTVSKHNFVFIEITNLFQPLECILIRGVESDGYNWKSQFLNLVREGLVKNDESTVVTIFSGTHGLGTTSGFTNCSDLKSNNKIYRKDEISLIHLKNNIKDVATEEMEALKKSNALLHRDEIEEKPVSPISQFVDFVQEQFLGLKDLKKEISKAKGPCNIKFNLENIKSYHLCLNKLPPPWFPKCVLMDLCQFLCNS